MCAASENGVPTLTQHLRDQAEKLECCVGLEAAASGNSGINLRLGRRMVRNETVGGYGHGLILSKRLL